MKKFLIALILLLVVSFVFPIITVKPLDTTNKNLPVLSKSFKPVKKVLNSHTFKIKNSETGEITELDSREYLFGCIASEMPISYEEEALKAQGIVAFTYALRKKENSTEKYDLTNDYTIDQCYKSREEIKQKWGENYDENAKKLESIIDEISGLRLTFNGETALSVYHAVSSGKTLTSKEVWGEDIPYLVSVDSSFDKLNEKYNSSVSVNKSDFIKDFELPDISDIKTEKSKNGKTDFLTVQNKKIPSNEIVKKYSLRSSCFDVDISGENAVVFNVFGYGHGVGMSQYGANCMAKNGSSYKEILLHYYKGCKIENS